MLKASELKEQSMDELKDKYVELSRDIFRFSNEIRVTRKMEKPHLMRERKRDRARVLTVLNQKGASITN